LADSTGATRQPSHANVSHDYVGRRPAAPFGLHPHLVLTYDNTRTDGVGAQLHRTYGIYAISRLLGASYLHSPLAGVGYQGLAALEVNAGDPGFHHEFNELFQIKSDAPLAEDAHTVFLPSISIAVFQQLAAMFDTRGAAGRPTLVRIVMPFGVADRYPDCYEVCKEISPFPPPAPVHEGRTVRVAVHVRRGELFVVDSDRMLPNGYYIAVAQRIARLLEAGGRNYQIELYTEVPSAEVVVEPERHGISSRITAPVVLTPEMCRLEEFTALPNLVHRVNGRAIECIRGMATADILVMSRSSLSYLGAILNRTGIVLYHPFWHRAPSSWMTVGPDGQFDEARLGQAVSAL
jgi:hypothetical protein